MGAVQVDEGPVPPGQASAKQLQRSACSRSAGYKLGCSGGQHGADGRHDRRRRNDQLADLTEHPASASAGSTRRGIGGTRHPRRHARSPRGGAAVVQPATSIWGERPTRASRAYGGAPPARIGKPARHGRLLDMQSLSLPRSPGTTGCSTSPGTTSASRGPHHRRSTPTTPRGIGGLLRLRWPSGWRPRAAGPTRLHEVSQQVAGQWERIDSARLRARPRARLRYGRSPDADSTIRHKAQTGFATRLTRPGRTRVRAAETELRRLLDQAGG